MPRTAPETAFNSFLYGGAATLLVFDLFFLVKALFANNFIPIVPIIAGIFTALGLLFVVYAEHQAREQDKRDHRRISRVAHQLESPLHALEINLDELIQSADRLPAEARLKLKQMETKTKVLLENVRDVFLTLQAQEHNVAQEVRVYDLCVLVNEVIERHKRLAAARNVEIIVKPHCQIAFVRIDKHLMQIVLNHIIENAIVYTLTPGLVNITVIKGEKHVRVVVQDRGIGISDTDAATIFQPFARGKRASEFDQDGIGVGLTLSRLLLLEFGGNIKWRNRQQGMGTEFEIVLPLVKK